MKSQPTTHIMNRLSKWFILSFIACLSATFTFAQVAINNDNSAPNASAMLDVKATGLGFLAPRMTFAQRPSSPATGLLIYQTDSDPGYYYFDGSAWQKIGRATSDYWLPNSPDIYFNAGRVAIQNTASESFGLNVNNYIAGKAAVRGTDKSSSIYADGMLGVLVPSGLGVPTTAYNAGVLGIKPNAGANGAAVLGWNDDSNSDNYAGQFIADGAGPGINYAIHADADSAATNWAGFFNGRIMVTGKNGNNGAADSLGNLITAQVTHTRFNDTYAVYGQSKPQPGYGYGLYGYGGYRGVYGYCDGDTYTGSTIGIYGYCTGSAGTRYGLYGYAYNTGSTSIGVYGTAGGATTNWAGYFSGDTYVSGTLRVGTTTAATGYLVSVNGKVACEEVLVEDSGSWPDFVFDKDYNLMSLDELEKSIDENNHLPGIPSAKEVEDQGLKLGDMQKKLLEKVEQLTLYTIQQEKMIKQLQQEVESLKADK